MAYPPFAVEHGNSCAVCHETSPDNGGLDGGGEERSDAMSVLSATLFDPDESSGTPPDDWKDRGALKMFSAKPGQTVELTMQVENGAIEYAVQLKRLEKEGFSGSGNKLAGHFTPDPSWHAHGTGDTTYFTNNPDDFDGHDFPVGSVVPFTYSLTLAADTPHDIYDLEFATAGRDSATTYGKWYGDEHFYLNVVPEPCTNVLIGLGLSILCLRKRRRSAQPQ
jgi:hypothetical protein